MILSIHVTHTSAGGIGKLDAVIAPLKQRMREHLESTDGLSEHIVVSTCNRFEVYCVTDNPLKASESFNEIVRTLVPSSGISYILKDRESIRHLFRVVCGLDSLIVGEDQIQHQIRGAYARAKEDGSIGPVLTRMFDRALAVGKKVRSNTSLNKGAVSIGTAAVELAESILGPLNGKSITILGAGDIATVIARNLSGKNLGTVFVSNRTYSHALELADSLGGTAVSMRLLDKALSNSDLVLVATSAPHSVLHREVVEEVMKGRPSRRMLIIDVCMPRNTDEDVRDVPGIQLETMGSLERIASENARRRTEAIGSAERILSHELSLLDEEKRESYANGVIREIGMAMADIRTAEMRTALSRAEAVPVEELVDDLSRAIVNKIANCIYSNLRKASREGRTDICDHAAELFRSGV